MHQIQEFGHAEPLVKVNGYTPPRTPEGKAKSKNGRRKGAKSG